MGRSSHTLGLSEHFNRAGCSGIASSPSQHGVCGIGFGLWFEWVVYSIQRAMAPVDWSMSTGVQEASPAPRLVAFCRRWGLFSVDSLQTAS